MNILNKIFKTLFLLLVVINFFNVYAYNLEYRGRYISDNGMCDIATMVQAAPSTISEYESSNKDANGWVITNTSSADTYGSSVTFDSFYYTFATIDKVFTTYNPGFQTTSWNGSNNIYYDTNESNRCANTN